MFVISALAVLGCTSGDLLKAGVPVPDSAAQADSGDTSDGAADSGVGGGNGGDTAPTDTGLAWSGDVAPYTGCVAGDPAAKFLSQTNPTGPVTAGAAVTGELVVANCEGVTWTVATSETSASGVKLASTSDTVTDTWGRVRVLLPDNVPPNVAVRLRWDAMAPLVNGPHPWQWQLVDEWVRWIGAPTPMVTLEVTGGYGPFTVHPRAEWETSTYPVEGPDMEMLALEYITIHYNGVAEDLDGDDDVYTDADTIESLRDTQSYYVRNRGASTGYNSQIAPDGDEWEIRGHDIRNAASGCVEVNRPGYTIQVPTVNPDAEPTPAQVEGVRAAVLRIRQAAAAAGNPNFLSINGHRDVRSLCPDEGGTSCPGEPLYGRIVGGVFEP